MVLLGFQRKRKKKPPFSSSNGDLQSAEKDVSIIIRLLTSVLSTQKVSSVDSEQNDVVHKLAVFTLENNLSMDFNESLENAFDCKGLFLTIQLLASRSTVDSEDVVHKLAVLTVENILSMDFKESLENAFDCKGMFLTIQSLASRSINGSKRRLIRGKEINPPNGLDHGDSQSTEVDVFIINGLPTTDLSTQTVRAVDDTNNGMASKVAVINVEKNFSTDSNNSLEKAKDGIGLRLTLQFLAFWCASSDGNKWQLILGKKYKPPHGMNEIMGRAVTTALLSTITNKFIHFCMQKVENRSKQKIFGIWAVIELQGDLAECVQDVGTYTRQTAFVEILQGKFFDGGNRQFFFGIKYYSLHDRKEWVGKEGANINFPTYQFCMTCMKIRSKQKVTVDFFQSDSVILQYGVGSVVTVFHAQQMRVDMERGFDVGSINTTFSEIRQIWVIGVHDYDNRAWKKMLVEAIQWKARNQKAHVGSTCKMLVQNRLDFNKFFFTGNILSKGDGPRNLTILLKGIIKSSKRVEDIMLTQGQLLDRNKLIKDSGLHDLNFQRKWEDSMEDEDTHSKEVWTEVERERITSGSSRKMRLCTQSHFHLQ